MRKHNKLRVWENSQVGLLWWSVGSRWGMKGMKGWWERNDASKYWGTPSGAWVDQMTAGVMKEVFEWTWSIKLGIIAVTDNTEHSKHFTDDEENTREYILILTRESDERNAAVRCDPAVILCELGMSDNFIESDICCPSQFTLCCCHHPRVCKALRLSPLIRRKRGRWRSFVVLSKSRRASEDRKSNGTKLKSFRVLIWIGSCPGRISEYWTYPMNDLGLCVEEMGLKISVKGFTVYTFSLQPPAVDWDTWL